MKRLSTLKGRAVLRRVTTLTPIQRNTTRWSSTYEMVQRYVVLVECFREVDHGTVSTISEHNLDSVLHSCRDHEKTKTLLDDLTRLEGVTKTLQHSTVTMSATRRLFGQVMQSYPEMKARLSATAAIITYPALETGLVPIQRGETLNAAEGAACVAFRAVQESNEHEGSERDQESM
ncbi:hypothetical protein PI124_g19266 [Phytophthora idaei]|nr:hypothetical protein PI124_g19266 [Phytophthora idaei]